MADHTIPVAGICSNCGKAVRNSEPYTYVEAEVWEQLGRNGRPQRIIERNTTGRVRCASCAPGQLGENLNLLGG